MRIVYTVKRYPVRNIKRNYCKGRLDGERESEVLRQFMKAARQVERGINWAKGSYVGQLVSPSIEYQHMWGMVDGVTEEVLKEVHRMGRTTTQKIESDESTLQKLCDLSKAQRNKGSQDSTETQLVLSSCTEIPDPETVFEALSKLLSYKRYRTTQEQATDELYSRQPNFSEQTFLHEVEMRLLPSFLQAFWGRDFDRLSTICTPSCYHMEIVPLLKEYETLQSRCRLLLASDSQIFNRLMLDDDSEFAASYESRASPVLFVAVTAQVINCWVVSDIETPNRRMHLSDFKNIALGDPYVPEDYVFVMGLIPERHGRWVLASFKLCRAQAIQ